MADLSLIPDAAWLEAQRRAEIIRPFAEPTHRPRQLIQAAAIALGLSERRTHALAPLHLWSRRCTEKDDRRFLGHIHHRVMPARQFLGISTPDRRGFSC